MASDDDEERRRRGEVIAQLLQLESVTIDERARLKELQATPALGVMDRLALAAIVFRAYAG